MKKIMRLALTLALLTIGYATTASAQATCPSSSRLEFINVTTGAVVNAATFATGPYSIAIGSMRFGLNLWNVAFITNLNTEACATYWLSDDGDSSDAEYVPTRNANLCMGNDLDMVETEFPMDPPVVCDGFSPDLEPMVYNGFSLRTYMGGGPDQGSFGAGADRVWGGAGADSLEDQNGTGDHMYGETDNDQLFCSAGPTTTCSGGGAPDYIEDLQGNGGSVDGGGSSDDIRVCDVKPVDCGISSPGNSDDDELWRESTANIFNCEHSYSNPDC